MFRPKQRGSSGNFAEQENNKEARHFEGGRVYCSGSWQLVVTRKTKNNQDKFRERWGKGVARQAVVDGELQLAGR